MDERVYRRFRHQPAQENLKYRNRYQFDSAELNDIQQTNPDPLQSTVLDLTTSRGIAADNLGPLELPFHGRFVVLYGVDTSGVGLFDPVTSPTGTDPVKTSAFVLCAINQDRADNYYPLKHARGFRGDIFKLFLRWPAQATTKARLIVGTFDGSPWQSGEAAT